MRKGAMCNVSDRIEMKCGPSSKRFSDVAVEEQVRTQSRLGLADYFSDGREVGNDNDA